MTYDSSHITFQSKNHDPHIFYCTVHTSELLPQIYIADIDDSFIVTEYAHKLSSGDFVL